MRMNELVVMRLFSEVEVRCNRVFEEMNDEVAKKNQKGRAAPPQFEALRNHLYQTGGQHESSTQSHKVAQVPPLPMPLHNDRPAKHVGRSGSKSQQYADQDRAHVQVVEDN